MRRAFTLVEILVCLAIVVVLTGVILAVVSQTKGSAKIAACQSNLKEITSAMFLYAGDHDDAIPVEVHPYLVAQLTDGSLYGGPWDAALRKAPTWPAAPLDYGATREQFHCPLDQGTASNSTEGRSAFARYRTSYLNDPLGGPVFKTFSVVSDSASRTLLLDRLGSNHGAAPVSDPFRTLVSCAAYDGHVRAAMDNECANAMTEVPAP